MNRNTLSLAAAALLLAGAGGAALAHPHPDGDGDKVKRFVIIQDGKEGEHHASGDRVRLFDRQALGRLADCDGGEKIVDDSAGDDDGKTTKVIICRKGAPTGADAERLEDALARITDNDHLSDEQKARIETALRSAIDRARSAR
jgi:hypothetical protein